MQALIALFFASLAIAAQGSLLSASTNVVTTSASTGWPHSTAFNSWNGWNTWNDYPNYQQQQHHGLVSYNPYVQDWSPTYGLYGHKTVVQANLRGHATYPWGYYGAGYAGYYGWGTKFVN